MLDTLKIADSLRKAGFGDAHARAIADTQKQTVEKGGLATKPDIDRLGARVDLTNERLNSLEGLVKWGFGALLSMMVLLLSMMVPIFLKLFLG